MNDHIKHSLEASALRRGESRASREVISETLQEALFKTQVDAVKVVEEPARNSTIRGFQGEPDCSLTVKLDGRWSQM